MAKIVPPSIASKSFTCPHCGALADQYWFTTYAAGMKKKDDLPFLFDHDLVAEYAKIRDDLDDEGRANHDKYLEPMKQAARGELAFEHQGSNNAVWQVHNLHLSKCYSCNSVAVWYRDGLLWPRQRYEIEPSDDMPAEVRADFEEARAVIEISPRSAAALLRLCIQKLCVEFGESGKNINDDIASLVKKGLDARTQRALDVVRVVGNNAVHPGEMNLKDNREVAEKLFILVNKIVYDMITHPKELEAIYGSLPANALAAIEKRDKQK